MRATRSHATLWLSSRHARWGMLLIVIGMACVSCTPTTTSVVRPVATVSGQSPRRLASSAWEQITLPVPMADIRGVAVAPTDPATILACSAQPMTLWRTSDTGAHWTRFDSTLSAGNQCLFSFAPDNPQRVTLQVTQPAENAQPCAQDTFYISDDGGVAWRKLPPHTSIAPAVVSFGWCELHVTRHHLFLAYSYAPSPQTLQVSLLERSDDNGASWVRADRGLGSDALYLMPVIGPTDTLAVTVIHTQPKTAATATELWASTDAGQTWRKMSDLPQGAGAFLLANPLTSASASNTWPAPDLPFYVLEYEQIPSEFYRERALMSSDRRGWTLLPPLPVSGVSNERAGILQALGVLPDGRLAVWGADPQRRLPAAGAMHDLTSAFWLWLWDPRTQHWQVMPSALNVTAGEGCGLCWQAQITAGSDGATYLYVSYLIAQHVGSASQGMLRVRLPSSH